MNASIEQRIRLIYHAKIRRHLRRERQRLAQRQGRVDREATCEYAADSAYLRCAVNPSGPCDTCPHYSPRPSR